MFDWTPIEQKPSGNIRALLRSDNTTAIGFYEPDIGEWTFENGCCLGCKGFYPKEYREISQTQFLSKDELEDYLENTVNNQ